MLSWLLERFSRGPRAGPAGGRVLTLFAWRIALLGAILAGLLAVGTVGLAVSEGVGPWYSFRWTLDTIATVGGFPQPRTTVGQFIHVGLIVVGVGTLFYALAILAELFATGHVGEHLAARRTQKMIDSLADHHIVCGYGRVGRQVMRDLRAARARFVVVDANSENRQLAEGENVPFIEGDATDDAVLVRAGIQRARSIIACADSDANNVFVTLTARELRGDIAIVARAGIEDTEKKLARAGADRVISPYKASGTEMARLALHPQLSGVVEVDVEYRLEEIVAGDGCEASGKAIGDIRGGSMIVGLRGPEGFSPQPPADTTIRPGDTLVAIGTPATLGRLEALLAPASAISRG
jgi:voltage-gated potassium channel